MGSTDPLSSAHMCGSGQVAERRRGGGIGIGRGGRLQAPETLTDLSPTPSPKKKCVS